MVLLRLVAIQSYLERIVSFTKYKLSCFMVVLTSTFTLTLGLFKCA